MLDMFVKVSLVSKINFILAKENMTSYVTITKTLMRYYCDLTNEKKHMQDDDLEKYVLHIFSPFKNN